VIHTDQRGSITVLTLDRPGRGNALVPELVEGLLAALREACRDPRARGLVLTGAGGAFCTGADLHWLGQHDDPAEPVARLVAVFHELIQVVRAAPFPVLAAVNGAAAGGGLSLALAADVRIGSPSASLTAAYFRLGLTPDGGSSAFLARSIGAARTMDLLLTNRTVGAEEARGLGLLSDVVEPERLVDAASQRARAMAGVPPSTLVGTRRLLDAAAAQPLAAQLQMEALAMRAAARHPDFKRAVAAFLARREQPRG
jgi:2-(1,2-epoxy-1,2-dihydrophenyl)acetyl-CoA isomerase